MKKLEKNKHLNGNINLNVVGPKNMGKSLYFLFQTDQIKGLRFN